MELVIVDNPAASRFEAIVDGLLCELQYRIDSGILVITHTEVPAALEGHGIAGKLTKFAFDSARERGLRVATRCAYAAAWIRRHPEYADRVV